MADIDLTRSILRAQGFATQNLQDHVCDIRTLQQWLGHNDLASTMVYLKAVRSKDVVARMNASKLTAFALGASGTVQTSTPAPQ